MVSAVSTIYSNPVQISNKDLQYAIDKNHLNDQILKNPDLVNTPLSNGQMPLNYAIRQRRQDIVQALFPFVKDPAAKDFQGLTALDHAMIENDPKMFLCVAGNLIGSGVDRAVSKPLSNQEKKWLEHFSKDVQQLKTGATFIKLPDLHAAAQKGDLALVKELFNPNDPNVYDANGMTPLHHAVLAGKKEVVQWLIGRVGKDVQTQNGKSLLLLASIGGHAELVSYFLEKHGFDPNASDSKGKRPLHYAFVSEDLSTAKMLIAHGANPLLSSDSYGTDPIISPLETMFAWAKESAISRDPLALTNLQVLMFAGIAGPWLSRLCGGIPGMDLVGSLGEIATFLTAYKSLKTWKSVAVFWGSFLVTNLAFLPLLVRLFINGDTTGARWYLGLVFATKAWQTYQVGKGVIQGLANCWKNRSLETYRPIRNAIVHTTIGTKNAAETINLVQAQLTLNRVLNAWDKYMETERESFQDLNEELMETGDFGSFYNAKIRFFNNFYNNYFSGKSTPPPPGGQSAPKMPRPAQSVPSFAPPTISKGQGEKAQYILTLDPTYMSQARKIMALSDKTDCKKAYLDLSMQFHPDKYKGVDADAVMARINQARETLSC